MDHKKDFPKKKKYCYFIDDWFSSHEYLLLCDSSFDWLHDEI